jgi:hypothetical protein
MLYTILTFPLMQNLITYKTSGKKENNLRQVFVFEIFHYIY